MTMLGTCLVLPLGGCWLTAGIPQPLLDVPSHYDGAPNPRSAKSATPSPRWWRAFRSRELTRIVDTVSIDNLDIAQAAARILQADAQARITGAALLPQVTLNSDASHFRTSQAGGRSSGGSESDSLTATLNASYEIDFWGKNRFALLAAQDTATATRYDRDVVALTAVATAANAYFQVLAAQDRLRVARNNLVSARRVGGLIGERAKAGTASALETAQQRSVIATLEAAIPVLEQIVVQYKNALAVLMGRVPERSRIKGGSLDALAIPRVTPGLPSELLLQRPDIREAEAQLSAANANIVVARAQFLPSVTLTGEAGYASAVLKTLLRPESAMYTLAAGLLQPVFEGGRLTGNLQLQEGRQLELLEAYRRAAISGFADVETALANVRLTAERERLQGAVVKSAREAFDVSEQRFGQGTLDLVTLLQTQQTLYSAEDALVIARLAHMQAVLSLYQALGGGWEPKHVEAADAR